MDDFDLRDLILALPVGAVLLIGMWAFCALVFAFGEPPR